MRVPFRHFLIAYMACLCLSLLSALTFGFGKEGSKSLINQALTLFALYLSGSIPFGLIITKALTNQDVRSIGSGNIGTTNVLRTGSKLAGALTLVCDILKGLLPILFLNYYIAPFPPELEHVIFLAPVLGHMYPCWLSFKGGKGIATGLGVILAFSWPLALMCLGLWIAIAKIFKMSSLAGLIAFGVAPVLGLFFAPWQDLIWLGLLSALVFFAHRDNIKRLLTGQENKIGDASS